MNSISSTGDSFDSQMAAMPRVVLEVQGQGHVPAIKNKMFAIVDKQKRSWKTRCVQDFVFQLTSGLATGDHATLTTAQLRSLTLLLPRDDAWRNIPELHVTGEKCEPGKEGATIIIEQLP